MIDSSVFSKYSLFDGLAQEQIDKVVSLMSHEVFEAGATIVVEGGHNDKIHFIIDGRVAVVKSGFTLTVFEEGSIFGEMEVLDVEPVEATVKALVTTNVMALSVDALGELFESDPRIYSFILMNLARDISSRLRRMNKKTVLESPAMDWS